MSVLPNFPATRLTLPKANSSSDESLYLMRIFYEANHYISQKPSSDEYYPASKLKRLPNFPISEFPNVQSPI